MEERLYPPRWSDRFYILTLLRKRIEAIVEKHLDGWKDSILVDLGCGQMPYRPIFAPYLARYIGADLPGNDRAGATIGPHNRTDLPDGVADVILSTQVLEHVASPVEYLEECHRLLKPNGLLILSTHGYWMYHPVPKDLWRWTGDGLCQLLSDGQFRVIEIEGLMGLGATGLLLFQDALVARLPRILKPFVSFGMQNLMWFFDHLNSRRQRQKDACTFVVVATKNHAHEERP